MNIFDQPTTIIMKKLLLLPALLLLGALAAHAQSIRFGDLVYMTPMSNEAVFANLKQGGAFKQQYSEDVDGYPMEYFVKTNGKPEQERIAAGRYTKLYNGTILRTLDYTSTDVQNVLNMVSQAKYFGMDLIFQGADDVNNIYLFSNNYYQVSIYVRRDQTAGEVEIKQKEYLNVE
jgi:hypothetical protein